MYRLRFFKFRTPCSNSLCQVAEGTEFVTAAAGVDEKSSNGHDKGSRSSLSHGCVLLCLQDFHPDFFSTIHFLEPKEPGQVLVGFLGRSDSRVAWNRRFSETCTTSWGLISSGNGWVGRNASRRIVRFPHPNTAVRFFGLIRTTGQGPVSANDLLLNSLHNDLAHNKMKGKPCVGARSAGSFL